MLVHNSTTPLQSLRDRSAEQQAAPKPTGLWLAEGADWIRWCAGAAMMADRVYPHFAQVEPGRETRIVKLEAAQDVADFTRDYCTSQHIHPWYQRTIDWQQVARDFDGIQTAITRISDEEGSEATPFWLHCWDVPSTCIWRPGENTTISRVPILTVLKWMEEIQKIHPDRSADGIVTQPSPRRPPRPA